MNVSPVYTQTITLDQTAPSITILSHASGTQVTIAAILLQGTGSDTNGVSRVRINGVTGDGTTSWSSLASLNGGKNTITIQASDTIGNTSSITTTIIRVPETSGISGFALSGSAAQIDFTTSVTSLGYVNYGTTNLSSAKSGTTATNHHIILDSLTDDTNYIYKVFGVVNGYT